MRSEMSTFRSEITTLHSDMPKVLMKHNGEIATLKERSNRFDGKAENNCGGPLNSWRWWLVFPFLTNYELSTASVNVYP